MSTPDDMLETLARDFRDHKEAEEKKWDEILQKMTVVEKAHTDFFIEPKLHYDRHAKMDRLLDFYDNAGNAAIKTLAGMLIVGILIIAAIGAGWNK